MCNVEHIVTNHTESQIYQEQRATLPSPFTGGSLHVSIQKMHYSLTSCQLYFLVPLSSFLAHLLALSRLTVNPFIALACKISQLKSACIHACKQYIWWSYNKQIYFQHCAFWQKSFLCWCERGRGSLNDLKFGTFIGHLPVSDSMQAWQWKG